ncbi:hypothetical protein [Streptomyces stelliscabiei]|uniref:hypothetical protein n=1 Tax=Streptomyces stelliscabiei TaxID=146820 RepID=UPI002FF001F4
MSTLPRTAVEDRVAATLAASTTHLAGCLACSRRRALVGPAAACPEGDRLIQACETAARTARQEDTR